MCHKSSTCALCLREADLMVSHLVPKAIYRRLKRGVASDLNSPVRVDAVKGTSVLTDSQPTLRLLCFDCEQRFCQKSEDIVVPELRSDGNFMLRDNHMRDTSILRSHDETPNTDLNREAYYYFAVSLAWRMSAANWRRPYNNGYKKLGPFEEQVRQWLLGEGDELSKIRVEIMVDTDEDSPALGGPDVSEGSDLSMNAKIYQLVALGVWFRVHVGGQLTKKGKQYIGTHLRPIAFHKVSFGGMGMDKYVNQLVAKTTYKGKLSNLR